MNGPKKDDEIQHGYSECSISVCYANLQEKNGILYNTLAYSEMHK
jgi:hypothetical protein